MRVDLAAFLSILSNRSASALASSKVSTTPPVKSSMASDVLPPFRASKPPYNLNVVIRSNEFTLLLANIYRIAGHFRWVKFSL